MKKKVIDLVKKRESGSVYVTSGRKARRMMWDIASLVNKNEKDKNPSIYVTRMGRHYLKSVLDQVEGLRLEHVADDKTLYISFDGVDSKIKARISKWLTKDIEEELNKPKNDLSVDEIKVPLKLFNPYHGGRWWIYEKVEGSIYMAFVNLGDSRFAELGTVDLEELASLSAPFGSNVPAIERDKFYETTLLSEIIDQQKSLV